MPRRRTPRELSSRHPPAIIDVFPTEIITKIVQAAPRADQQTFCLVSRYCHQVSLPVLYQVIVLRFDRKAALGAFCSSLVAQPARAEAIRSLTFLDGCIPGESEDLHNLLAESMKLMTNLERLSFDRVSNYWQKQSRMFPRLSLLTFENLRRCSLDGVSAQVSHPATDSDGAVASFLTRHREITHLSLSASIIAASTICVSLPNLQYYDGPSELLTEISTSGLKGAQLMWSSGPPGLDIGRSIGALKSLTNPDLPFILSNAFYVFQDDFKEILVSLSSYLWHTTSLQLKLRSHPQMSEYSLINQQSIHEITECLPRLSRLVYLTVDYSDRALYLEEMGVGAEIDPGTLQAWADACPTLEACSLYDRAWKKVDGKWVRCHIREFRAKAGCSAFDI
ncbi:hypothetical protein DFH08DRAFT_887868 [Mycena albidolilacea]|uniref:F-box domain-containing protein n=1 Tax=Mycena albidolilacea TaxID=1033008 RepID=A0AAD7EGR3_9AGAR|nr:hypothetical protein DFH08DRAFT_887868 [Mycena albidolilacea]